MEPPLERNLFYRGNFLILKKSEAQILASCFLVTGPVLYAYVPPSLPTHPLL